MKFQNILLLKMKHTKLIPILVLASALSSSAATVAGSFRDIQFSNIDFTNQVVELHNFGSDTIALDGWRFCSHDETDGFDYTSSSGLNGQSIAAGESFFIHWSNDADPTAANALNISSLGGNWIDDLNASSSGEAVSINLYNNNLGGFGSSAAIGDHIQYSFDGANIGSPANVRGGVATNANIWGDTSDWISVNGDSTGISLNVGQQFTGVDLTQGSNSFSVQSIPEPSSALLSSLGLLFLLRRKR